jgi:glycine/D-amino acid oxidase-like deaminating enzyme
MLVDYLIIGQGISGTWLSYYLQKEEKNFLIIDNNSPDSSSKIAAGIINPVTGRRHVTVWMAEEILPFAWDAYNEIGKRLGISTISQKNIIDFFPSPQMRLSFLDRIEEDSTYVKNYPDQNHFLPIFNYEFGCGEIHPVYIVHLETLLPAWRQQLKLKNQLLEEEFEIKELIISKH